MSGPLQEQTTSYHLYDKMLELLFCFLALRNVKIGHIQIKLKFNTPLKLFYDDYWQLLQVFHVAMMNPIIISSHLINSLSKNKLIIFFITARGNTAKRNLI